MNDRACFSIADNANPTLPNPSPPSDPDNTASLSTPSGKDDNRDEVPVKEGPSLTDMGGSHGCHKDRTNDSDDPEKAPYPPATSVRTIRLDESSVPDSAPGSTSPNESSNPKRSAKDRKKNKTPPEELTIPKSPSRGRKNIIGQSGESVTPKNSPRVRKKNKTPPKELGSPNSPQKGRKKNQSSSHIISGKEKNKTDTPVRDRRKDKALHDNGASLEEDDTLERKITKHKDRCGVVIQNYTGACERDATGVTPDILSGTVNAPSKIKPDNSLVNPGEQAFSMKGEATLSSESPTKDSTPSCNLSSEQGIAEPEVESVTQLSTRCLTEDDVGVAVGSVVGFEFDQVRVVSEHVDIRETINNTELEKVSFEPVSPSDENQDGQCASPAPESGNTNSLDTKPPFEPDSDLDSSARRNEHVKVESNKTDSTRTMHSQNHQEDSLPRKNNLEKDTNSTALHEPILVSPIEAATIQPCAEGRAANSANQKNESGDKEMDSVLDERVFGWLQYDNKSETHATSTSDHDPDLKLIPTEFETNIEDEDDLSETHFVERIYSTDETESETFDSLETILASPEIYDNTKHFSSADESSSLTELHAMEELHLDFGQREQIKNEESAELSQAEAASSDLNDASLSGHFDNDKEIDDNTINEMKEDSLRSHNVSESNTELKIQDNDPRETSDSQDTTSCPEVHITHTPEGADTSKPKRGSEIICDVIDAYNSETPEASAEQKTSDQPLALTADSETYENEVENITKSTRELIMSDEKLVLSLEELDDKVPTIVAVGGDTYDIYDKTPTSDGLPEIVFDEDQMLSTEVKSTSYTESDLDLSEQRDDRSSDSMYADDEDDGVGEVLFSRTYPQPGQGGEVLVSCTIVNSDMQNADPDDFWGDSGDNYDHFHQIEISANAASCAFFDARKQMQEIHMHLQNLRVQMEQLHDELETATLSPEPEIQPLDMLSSETDSRRGITD